MSALCSKRPAVLTALAGLVLLTTGFGVPTGFTLTLQPETTSLVVGEPLTLTITAQNTTGSDLEGPDALAAPYGLLALHIAQGEEPFRRFLAPGWGSRGARPTSTTYAAGASIAETVTVLWSDGLDAEQVQGLAFPEPGTYQLRATWIGLDGEMLATSEVVSLTVNAASGADAAVRDALLADAKLARAVQAGRAREGTEAASALQTLRQRHPGARTIAAMERRRTASGTGTHDAAWEAIADNEALLFALHTGRMPEGETTAQQLRQLIADYPGSEIALRAAWALREAGQ